MEEPNEHATAESTNEGDSNGKDDDSDLYLAGEKSAPPPVLNYPSESEDTAFEEAEEKASSSKNVTPQPVKETKSTHLNEQAKQEAVEKQAARTISFEDAQSLQLNNETPRQLEMEQVQHTMEIPCKS
jgi:hypothetical protein